MDNDAREMSLLLYEMAGSMCFPPLLAVRTIDNSSFLFDPASVDIVVVP